MNEDFFFAQLPDEEIGAVAECHDMADWYDERLRQAEKKLPYFIAYLRLFKDRREMLCNPVIRFNDEWKHSQLPDGRLSPTSYLGKATPSDYHAMRSCAEDLGRLWRGKREAPAASVVGQILGMITLDVEFCAAFGLLEPLLWRHESDDFFMVKLDFDEEIMDAINLVRENIGWQGERRNPAYTLAHSTRVARATSGDETSHERILALADDLSRTVWQFSAICSNECLVGRLLLMPDYGLSYLHKLEEYDTLFYSCLSS